MKKRILIVGVAVAMLILGACTAAKPIKKPMATPTTIDSTSTQASKGEDMKITGEEGKKRIDENPDIIILDVRTQDEYNEERIPNAILIPEAEISSKAEETLTNKDAEIIVYCRSGRRSAIAANQLIDMGYTKVYDMGGIADWAYETQSGSN